MRRVLFRAEPGRVLRRCVAGARVVERAVPLIAVTNGNADLQLTGGGEFFRETLSARAFGFAKPEPEIFHAAAAALGVRTAELLHVGDDFHLDIVGALNAGLQAAWVVRDERPEAEHAAHRAPSRHLTIRDLSALCRVLGGPVAGV
ncbi:HAD family hydrolase [Burkholderia anthina]|uniref:HAD family hydrolase n=1 Tax=Burkholderia anthina TaxID=179879 RepID=UPI003132CCB9